MCTLNRGTHSWMIFKLKHGKSNWTLSRYFFIPHYAVIFSWLTPWYEIFSLLAMSELTAKRSSVHNEQFFTRENRIQVFYSGDIGARSRYLGQRYIIASHRILWDAITYPCLRSLLPVPKSSYMLRSLLCTPTCSFVWTFRKRLDKRQWIYQS